MKPAIWIVGTVAGLLLAAAEIGSSTQRHSGGLVVHEWGTFTSVAGEDGSAIAWDVLGGKDDLPRFVNDFGFRCFKSRLTGTVRMETPVIYFYSPREVTARVSVEFPHGVITEWYPRAEAAVYQEKYTGGVAAKVKVTPSGLGYGNSLNHLLGTIGWNDIKVQPAADPGFPVEPGVASHYYAARGTDAAPIAIGDQQEKFLFYRGIGRFAVPLSARISDRGGVVIEANGGEDPVPGVILFEIRGRGRLGYRNVGTVRGGDATLVEPVSLDGLLDGLRQEFDRVLVAQGLFPKEARAMVDTWRDSWFEEGSRLIYVVPSRMVNEILPLHVEPLPERTARVFVGRIELVSAETKRVVEEAVVNRDWASLGRHGRFLEPILARTSSEHPGLRPEIEGALNRIGRSPEVAGVCRR